MAPRAGLAVVTTVAVPWAGTVTEPAARPNMPAGAGVPASAPGSRSYGPPATVTVSLRLSVTGAGPLLAYVMVRLTGVGDECGHAWKPKYAEPVAVTVEAMLAAMSSRPAPTW